MPQGHTFAPAGARGPGALSQFQASAVAPPSRSGDGCHRHGLSGTLLGFEFGLQLALEVYQRVG